MRRWIMGDYYFGGGKLISTLIFDLISFDLKRIFWLTSGHLSQMDMLSEHGVFEQP